VSEAVDDPDATADLGRKWPPLAGVGAVVLMLGLLLTGGTGGPHRLAPVPPARARSGASLAIAQPTGPHALLSYTTSA
jgi:hypothetical protein